MSTSKSRRDSWVAGHISSLPKSGIRDFFDIVSTMKEVISLGIGEPDFVTPWNIRESTIYALNRGYTAYTSNLGDLKLRKAIAAHAEESFLKISRLGINAVHHYKIFIFIAVHLLHFQYLF